MEFTGRVSIDTLPPEIQHEIFSRTRLALPTIAATSTSLNTAVKKHPAYEYSSIAISFLRRSDQLTTQQEIEGVEVNPVMRREISQLFAEFNIKIAIDMASSIKNEQDKSIAQKSLVQAILPFNKEEALKIAQVIPQSLQRAEALSAVAEEVAIQSKIEALKIADSIEENPFKTLAYIKIATIRAIFDFKEALEVIQLLSGPNKVRAYCEMMKSIDRKDGLIAQPLLEEARGAVLLIRESRTNKKTLTEVDAFLSEDQQKATGADDKDFLSQEIEQLIESDIEKAAEAINSIENRELKYFLLRKIIKKYALSHHEGDAFQIALSELEPNSLEQTLAIIDVLKIILSREPKKGLECLKNMTVDRFSVFILLECAKEFMTQGSDLGIKLLESAIKAAHSPESGAMKKAELLTEIARMISTWQWRYTR